MLWPDRCSTRAVILASTALCFTLPFFAFRYGFFNAYSHVSADATWLGPNLFDVKPPHPPPEFYDWPTRSAFDPVRYDDASNKSIAELCAAFPLHLLNDIQPVLKTGHALLQERLTPHFQSVSACLTSLLVYSDLEEEFEGRRIIDVIADLPSGLQHWSPKSPTHVDQLAPYTALQELRANGTLDSVDTSAILSGWKTDKFKFLPAISRTWMMRPEKSWYFFFEDDTYVMWDNVFRLLTHFDPELPWYFGSPAPGRKPAQDKPKTWFGYGGTGYILSRAAMRSLVKNDYTEEGAYLGTKLTERWWNPEILTNCCGDSILGWALWNERIPLAGMWPMLSPNKPQKTSFSNKHWCQPVVSMHKPSAEDMLGLWRWEFEQRKMDRPLIWRDLAVSYFNFSTLTTRQDWDNVDRGSYRAPAQSPAYSHDPHASFDACRTACEALPKCLQYSYHIRKCKLDHQFRFGFARAPELGKTGKDLNEMESEMVWEEEDLRFQSGWVREKIQKWMDERPCEKVQWVRPSIDRVF